MTEAPIIMTVFYVIRYSKKRVKHVVDFLVYNAVQDRKEFGTVMKFERSLVKYKFERSVDEIEKIVQEMKKVMDGNKIPKSNTSCQNCAFIRAGSKLLNGK